MRVVTESLLKSIDGATFFEAQPLHLLSDRLTERPPV